MLKIRLKRTGRKNQVFYKIVLMESVCKRDGKSVAELGYYDPIGKLIKLNKFLLHKALNSGAYPTDTVRHLIFQILNNKSIYKS
jgi:small subunit ribosomal protein S16